MQFATTKVEINGGRRVKNEKKLFFSHLLFLTLRLRFNPPNWKLYII